jgi:hypothetical protein
MRSRGEKFGEELEDIVSASSEKSKVMRELGESNSSDFTGDVGLESDSISSPPATRLYSEIR